MTEERMKVLEILQEGKINAEEAARLLDALGKTTRDEDRPIKLKIRMNTDEDA
ncbi:MAG: hypothetical protein O3B73_02870 [bacterium]|jgi:polyhydroxyalkanoate synthesis regulator phasin|nr:hypothetical protein [bacterium]